jgi:MFS family permease
MWKATFKQMFGFFFDNPVIFLIILANYALLFMFAPLIGLIAGFFIATLYLIGIHGSINRVLEEFKNYARWGFIVAIVLYILYSLVGVVSYYLYAYLINNFHPSFGAILLFTIFYSLLVSLMVHPVYITLFASKDFEEFRKLYKNWKKAYITKVGFYALLLFWGFMFLTLLVGLIKFLHFTVGLYSVIATFWLTYYTFLGVKVFKTEQRR